MHNQPPNAARRSSDAVPAASTRASRDGAAQLFDLQLAFNLFPAAYVHSSWLAEIHPSLACESDGLTAASPFWVRRLSSALLRQRRLDVQFDCDFFDPAKRLALLDAATLIRIAGIAGAIAMRERIRRTVDRAEIESMQRAIGAQAHRLALLSIAPAAELAVLVMEAGEPWPDADSWAARTTALLCAAIPPASPGVLGRLLLKFPRAWTVRRMRLAEPQRRAVAQLLIDVASEHAADWRWLLNTEVRQ